MTPITLQSLADGVFRASWQACLLAIVILAVQSTLGRRISPRARYALWSLVLLRLAIPVTIPTPLSLHNFYPRPAPIAETHYTPAPAITLEYLPAQPTAAPTVSFPRPMSWPQKLSIAWFIGALTSGLLILATTFRLALKLRRMPAITDPRLTTLLRACADEIGIHRLPTLLAAPSGPALVGYLNPRLLLPAPILSFDDASLRLILLHELAHQKRGDVLANWLLAAIQSIHWFNPVVHLTFARIRGDRELACDDRVLSLTEPADRPAYGRTIVRLIESLSDKPRVPALAVGILEGRRQLRRRITMIAEHRPARRTWSLAAMLLASLTAAVACTDAVGQSPGTAQPAPQPVGPGGLAAPQAAPAPGTEPPAFAAPDDRLMKRIPQIKLDNIPLSDALDFVRDQAKLNLFIDRKALEAAGVELDAPVSLDLKDITVEQAFRLIGKSAAPTGVELGPAADGDVIVFTASGPANSLVPGAMVPGSPVAGTLRITGPDAGLPFAAAPPRRNPTEHAVVHVYDVDRLVGTDAAKLTTLTQVISTSLNLTKNSVFQGMQPFNGKLVVTASPDVQLQVVDILQMLKESAPATTKPAPSKEPRPASE